MKGPVPAADEGAWKVKRSTRACNPEGLLEKELRARECHGAPPGKKYKKR